MSTARRAILVVASGLMLALPATARAADGTVHIQEGPLFSPGDVTVTAGGSVRWRNDDAFTHDAAAIDGTWQTPHLGIGQEATITFSTVGTYAYLCSLHPIMRGTVTVLPAPPDTSIAPAGTRERPNGTDWLVLVLAGLIGAALALRRFRTAST